MDLTRIPEIRGVERAGAEWRIGAATTFTEIQRAPGLREGLPALAEAASWVGGWQIQNRATLGGNMANASPAGDSLPVLLVLDAEVVMVGPRGTRSIPYARFHVDYRRTALGPDEIIGWVRIPVPAPGTVQRFRKVGTREAQSISKVVVAMAARPHEGRLERVRLAAGSVAPIPVRLPAVESACEGGRPGEALAERAAEAAMDSVTPIDDVRSTAIYRKHVLGRVVRRMVLHMALRG
jgi:CO/xanthine dehydrogenase FAD-binding subunit